MIKQQRRLRAASQPATSRQAVRRQLAHSRAAAAKLVQNNYGQHPVPPPALVLKQRQTDRKKVAPPDAGVEEGGHAVELERRKGRGVLQPGQQPESGATVRCRHRAGRGALGAGCCTVGTLWWALGGGQRASCGVLCARTRRPRHLINPCFFLKKRRVINNRATGPRNTGQSGLAKRAIHQVPPSACEHIRLYPHLRERLVAYCLVQRRHVVMQVGVQAQLRPAPKQIMRVSSYVHERVCDCVYACMCVCMYVCVRLCRCAPRTHCMPCVSVHIHPQQQLGAAHGSGRHTGVHAGGRAGGQPRGYAGRQAGRLAPT